MRYKAAILAIGLCVAPALCSAAFSQVALCDALAAAPEDAMRPLDVPGVTYRRLDAAKAVPACRKARAERPAEARILYQLARSLERAEKDLKGRIKLHREAYEKGSISALLQLATYLYTGTGVKIDPAEAFRLLTKEADAGQPRAMSELGALYLQPGHTPHERELALAWSGKAAALGQIIAMNNLGVSHVVGLGVQVDHAEGRRWFEKAAALGSTDAMVNLGSMAYEGQGGPVDFGQARYWFEKAALLDDESAIQAMGAMNAEAIGGPANFEAARGWYEKGAAFGDAPAMTSLGDLYAVGGPGLNKDITRARKWYKRAIAAGDKEKAQKHLEQMNAATPVGKIIHAINTTKKIYGYTKQTVGFIAYATKLPAKLK